MSYCTCVVSNMSELHQMQPSVPIDRRQQPSRKAQPRDIFGAKLSRSATQIWVALCDHRSAANLAYPKLDTLAGECRLSRRTVQRALEELRECGWICMPDGDAG